MSTSTRERPTRERAAWVCENCQGLTATARKRCAECGTSRY
jgi:RNA polymerase subunit RPABC4/transcription elongation factor Spt4